MLEQLKQEVLTANLRLPKEGLAISTWGNVSAIDRDAGLIVIKASGVPYSEMGVEHMTVADMEGTVVEGEYKPSSDLMTHLELYLEFSSVGSIIHTHSRYATIWAQAGKDIPCLGTTHSDYFYGAIPCTRQMTMEEIKEAYELNTGKVITERFKNLDPAKMHAVLVNDHGPFVWGQDPTDAMTNALVLEYIAHMASFQCIIEAAMPPEKVQDVLLNKHYNRKFGPDAYYGQHYV